MQPCVIFVLCQPCCLSGDSSSQHLWVDGVNPVCICVPREPRQGDVKPMCCLLPPCDRVPVRGLYSHWGGDSSCACVQFCFSLLISCHEQALFCLPFRGLFTVSQWPLSEQVSSCWKVNACLAPSPCQLVLMQWTSLQHMHHVIWCPLCPPLTLSASTQIFCMCLYCVSLSETVFHSACSPCDLHTQPSAAASAPEASLQAIFELLAAPVSRLLHVSPHGMQMGRVHCCLACVWNKPNLPVTCCACMFPLSTSSSDCSRLSICQDRQTCVFPCFPPHSVVVDWFAVHSCPACARNKPRPLIIRSTCVSSLHPCSPDCSRWSIGPCRQRCAVPCFSSSSAAQGWVAIECVPCLSPCCSEHRSPFVCSARCHCRERCCELSLSQHDVCLPDCCSCLAHVQQQDCSFYGTLDWAAQSLLPALGTRRPGLNLSLCR